MAQSSGPASVAVQPGDVPKGMVRCDLTGDINSFIRKEQTPDPTTAKSAADEWARSQRNGATAAYAAVYTDSAAHCSTVKSSTSDIAAASYKLVVNFVIQFNSEKNAANAYTNDSIFGASPPNLRSGGSQAIEGTKTGLGANSIVVSQAISNQTFYIALWQNKTFAVFLAVLNVDPATSKKIAIDENARIR